MSIQHAAIWLGPPHARVLRFENQRFSWRGMRGLIEFRTVGEPGEPALRALFDDLYASTAAIPELLLLGNAAAIAAFEQHVAAHDPPAARRIRGMQAMEVPSDGALAVLARWHFTRPAATREAATVVDEPCDAVA